jgi:hypothetical protein
MDRASDFSVYWYFFNKNYNTVTGLSENNESVGNGSVFNIHDNCGCMGINSVESYNSYSENTYIDVDYYIINRDANLIFEFLNKNEKSPIFGSLVMVKFYNIFKNIRILTQYI